MEEKTLKALHGSIAKWEGVRDGTISDSGIYNCPLCILFFNTLGQSDDIACKGCPVYEKTGKQYCVATPYTQWTEAGLKGCYASNSHERRLAQAEIDFLKSLLPKPE